MTEIKKHEIEIINKIQDKYIQQLIKIINDSSSLKEINFTSPTGTGKSKMIAKLINSEWGKQHFFVITTLSRGELNIQIDESLQKDCSINDFIVYGSSQLTATTILKPEDVQATVRAKANNRPIIWIRDEGHIETNSFKIALENMYEHIINFSATNSISDMECDFSSTCMLRTPVVEKTGDVAAALDRLLIIKKEHAIVPHYNPCAVFRCINNPELHNQIVVESQKRGLKYIDLNEDDSIHMKELCKDDNEYDVIINKMKIVEGVDLKRAHVMYLGNIPSNPATIIQFAGRARRNALLWKEDFDIFDSKYTDLYNSTRNCYIFFNVDCKDEKEQQEIEDTLRNVFRDTRSVNEFVVGTELKVVNGQLLNGIYVYQLLGQTGTFIVKYDEQLKCNVVNPLSDFYATEEKEFGTVPKHGFKVVEQELWGEHTIGYYDTEKNINIPCTGYNPYKQKINDYESAAISCEYFKYISDAKKWLPMRSISDFLDKTSSKAVAFIDNKYQKELNQGIQYIEEHHLSSGKNTFKFNKICNSCLGWLVEFYTKYLIFGREFLFEEIKMAQKEAKTDEENEPIIFYACFLKYKKIMIDTFGKAISKFITGPSISDYIKKDYQEFVNTVITLAKRTQSFLINEQHLNFRKNGLLFNENLAIRNIGGKADFVTEDTIVDLKTTNNITKRYIRQVLFYHYLSTKRSDLNIKRVIVYDCVSNNYVEIPINVKNYSDYYNPISKLDDNDLPTISRNDLDEKVFLQSCNIKTVLLKWVANEKLREGRNRIFFINEKIDLKTDKQKQTEELLLSYAAENSGWINWNDILIDFWCRTKPIGRIYKSINSILGIARKHVELNKGKEFEIDVLRPRANEFEFELSHGSWRYLHGSWIHYLYKEIPLIQIGNSIYYVYDNTIEELEYTDQFVYYDEYSSLLCDTIKSDLYKQLKEDFITEITCECFEFVGDLNLTEQDIKTIYLLIYNAIERDFDKEVIINTDYIGTILKNFKPSGKSKPSGRTLNIGTILKKFKPSDKIKSSGKILKRNRILGF